MSTLSIPGVETVHPRAVWEPADYQMQFDFHRTPPALDFADVDRAAIHYTSAIDLPDGDPDEILNGIDGIRQILARTTIDYYTNRTGGGYRRLSDGRWFDGFPFGYSFAVDWLGGVWEGRGWDYTPAATGGHNGHTIAILMLTDRYDPASDLMWQSARAIQREANRRGASLPNRPWAHGWFREITGTGTPTACCGDALKQQIHEGYGDLDRDPDPPPGGDMSKPTVPLVTPERAYDSRPDFQDQVNPILREANKGVPQGAFRSREMRKIFVGMTNSVEVNVAALGITPGWVKVAGSDVEPTAGATQIDPDGVESNCVPVATPDGHIRVWAQNPCHIVVDVFARG